MSDGSRHSMALIAEVAYGSTPATPAFAPIRHTGTTLGLSKDTLQSEELRADRQIADYRHGARQVGGDINVELSYGSFDIILEALLGGTWDTDEPVADTDQLKAGVTRRSFTIERFFSDLTGKPYHRFTGCEFNTMQLQVSANAMITAVFGVVGKDLTVNAVIVTDATYGDPTTNPPMDSFTGTLNEDGTPIAVITEIQLNLDNGLDPRFVVGSKTTERPSIGRSNLSGSITAYFETVALMEKFIDETESSIDFTLPDGLGNELKFILPRIKYNGGQPDVSGDGPITLAMPFMALYDETEETNIIIERTPAA